MRAAPACTCPAPLMLWLASHVIFGFHMVWPLRQESPAASQRAPNRGHKRCGAGAGPRVTAPLLAAPARLVLAPTGR